MSQTSFEQFCARHNLACHPVPTASDIGEQRPDYHIVGRDGTTFFAEVKEVTPNPVEAEQIRRLLAGQVAEFRTEPGAKVREFIAKANAQLRAMTKGRCPGVLVIFNENSFLGHHTEPYAILTAMRGLDVIPVLVPKDPLRPPEFQEVRSGPKKKMTSGANRSISAILLPLDEPGIGSVGHVYHNHHTVCPLPLSALPGNSFRHFRIRADERGWDLLEAAV